MMLAALLLFAVHDDGSSRVWQSCVTRTAEDWSALKVDPAIIVESSFIHCRRELDNYMIAQVVDFKSKGISAAEAEKLASGLAGILAYD